MGNPVECLHHNPTHFFLSYKTVPNQKQIEDKVAQILSNPEPIVHQKFEKLVNHWNIELIEITIINVIIVINIISIINIIIIISYIIRRNGIHCLNTKITIRSCYSKR